MTSPVATTHSAATTRGPRDAATVTTTARRVHPGARSLWQTPARHRGETQATVSILIIVAHLAFPQRLIGRFSGRRHR
jgi:hypothetical protein